MIDKRFTFTVECLCGYKWETNTNMKYYVTCPDCKKPVYIGDKTGVKRLDFS